MTKKREQSKQQGQAEYKPILFRIRDKDITLKGWDEEYFKRVASALGYRFAEMPLVGQIRRRFNAELNIEELADDERGYGLKGDKNKWIYVVDGFSFSLGKNSLFGRMEADKTMHATLVTPDAYDSPFKAMSSGRLRNLPELNLVKHLDWTNFRPFKVYFDGVHQYARRLEVISALSRKGYDVVLPFRHGEKACSPEKTAEILKTIMDVKRGGQ